MNLISNPGIFLVIAATALWATHGSVRSASIGVNFASSANIDPLDPTDSAGVTGFAQSNYNNVFSTPNNLILNDNIGAATTATLTLTAGNVSFGAITGFAPFGPDDTLNRSGAFGNFGDLTFALNNISYAS